VLLVLVLLLTAPLPAAGSALTTTIAAHERSCFYAYVDKVGEKVGFYFAVSRQSCPLIDGLCAAAALKLTDVFLPPQP
jgi:hypothetical protein